MMPMAIVLAVLASGCSGWAGEESDASPTTGDPSPAASRPMITVPSLEVLPSDEGAPVIGEVPAQILEAILADASRQTGIGEEQIEVIRAEAVTWNDGSLGCPEPGMVYTQALVDGYHVVLDADGEELDYRVGSGGSFRICDQPSSPGG